ncbi:type IV pilus biogenesis protein PilM [Photobacterium aphoticum]|uniref:Pilus assembly protein PilM n=1 Tax=Photobacterium aphoticum TaxID=754436 RepID=A0A090QRN7_9GAMM|nr:type IV pilus assembly protein PilM [Photobacterium aphoticum]KLU99623.1 pilus assembly protein PilM [Photobacterium aphoticum]PSU54809.1 pilus assembly protein PilM [Photobacterium aphoticum]GAL05850.1 type IV pilus biogenesis protein PilM [Photobacterium aphoticum]GHA44302.1 pilus assembly protein PilM [Photobacterium aphoticum]
MFRNPLTIGIDIGHHSVKAVVLRQKKAQLELAAFAEVVLPASVVNEQHSVNTPALLSAIRKLKKSLPFGAKNVVLALPDSAVISKVIQLDTNLSDDESVFAVEQALSASSPFPIEELRLDFFPLASQSFSQPAQTQPVQVFAARRETVDSRVDAIRKAKLNPKVVELQTHALLWLEEYVAEQQNTSGQWGVVNIGKTRTEFCVKPAGGAAYHRELAFGCQALQGVDLQKSEDDSPRISISSEQAEQFTKQLVDTLKRQLQLYNSTHPRASLQGLWIAGGGQSVVVKEMLERMLGLDVKLMFPFASFERDQKMDMVIDQGSFSQYAVAAGLALRGGDAS